MASDSDNYEYDWSDAQFEPELSIQEKELRDRFVKEYLFDYDATRAAMRVGFMEVFAKDYGKRFLNESYVQNKIRELQSSAATTNAEKEKQVFISWLKREACYTGPGASHAARVGAIAKLTELFGMNKGGNDPAIAEQTGVMVVPHTQSAEEWGKRAQSQQQKLKEDVRD